MAEQFTHVARVPMQLTQGCLIASIQVDLNQRVLEQFQQDLLDKIRCTQTKMVVLDVSGVEIIDREEFIALRKSMEMARLMGSRTMIVGIRAGIACALLDYDIDFGGLETALTLDQAFEILLPVNHEEGDWVAQAEEPDEPS